MTEEHGVQVEAGDDEERERERERKGRKKGVVKGGGRGGLILKIFDLLMLLIYVTLNILQK